MVMLSRSSRIFAATVLCFYVIHSTDALVCYDNMHSGDKIVRIGCDFDGAACARTRLKNYTGTHVYYHCAKRTSTCKFGPSTKCTNDQTATCHTQCCDTDECNAPWYEAAKAVPRVDPANAITCYQLIGHRLERIKCLYPNARCVYYDIKPQSYDLTYAVPGRKYIVNFFCSISDQCAVEKQKCTSYSSLKRRQRSNLRCSMECCETTGCNSPRNRIKMTSAEVPYYDKARITYSWEGHEINKTMKISTTTTTSTAISSYGFEDDGSSYRSTGSSGRLVKYGIGIGISAITVIAGVIVLVLKCTKRIKLEGAIPAATQSPSYNPL